jgi:hypothetical protein
MNDVPEAGKAGARPRWRIFNATEGIPAMQKTFFSPEAAKKAIGQFRQRFELQGYYLTSAGERIHPADIKLDIVQS